MRCTGAPDNRSLRHSVQLITYLALASSCVDASGPARPDRVVELISGAGQVGLVSNELPALILVRVTDRATGRPLPGVGVEWQTPPGNGVVTPGTTTTDHAGDAWARWALGPVAKRDTALVVVPGARTLVVTATAVTEFPSPPIPPVARIDVSPTRFGGFVGDTLRFTATGRDADDYLRDLAVEWSVVGDAVTLERLDSVSARARATKVGQVMVRATLVGNPAVVGQAVVTVLTASDFASVHGAGARTCALASGGTAYCWGNNFNEMLATPTLDGCPLVECNRTPVLVRGGLRFASLDVGERNVCGLTGQGAAYCWGDNLFGQMGDGTGGNSFAVTSPTPAAGSLRFASITVGSSHACGLTAVGKAYCWGHNDFGQLGVGDASLYQSFEPMAVTGSLTFAQLSAGQKYTCGVTNTGEAYCWGAGGALGNGVDIASRAAPTRVAGDVAFRTVVAGEEHTCAIAVTGKPYCWGANYGGALGGGSTALYGELAPAPVATDLAFTQIAAGSRFTCGLTTSGEVYCWGTGDHGRLGRGSKADSGVPAPVSGGQTFTSIAAGYRHACATRADGVAFCWGDGYDGALGNGTMDVATQPRAVSVPF